MKCNSEKNKQHKTVTTKKKGYCRVYTVHFFFRSFRGQINFCKLSNKEILFIKYVVTKLLYYMLYVNAGSLKSFSFILLSYRCFCTKKFFIVGVKAV